MSIINKNMVYKTIITQWILDLPKNIYKNIYNNYIA